MKSLTPEDKRSSETWHGRSQEDKVVCDSCASFDLTSILRPVPAPSCGMQLHSEACSVSWCRLAGKLKPWVFCVRKKKMEARLRHFIFFIYLFIYLYVESCSMLFGVKKGIVNIACCEDIVLRVLC